MAILTISCQLAPTPEQAAAFDETLDAFARGCNLAIEAGREAGTTSNIRIHGLCYYRLRDECGLSANLAVRAIARAAGILKVKERQHSTVRPTSADYDQRIFSFREADWTVSLTTMQGRIKGIALVIGEYQRQQLAGHNPTSATLCKRRDGRYFLNVQVTSDDPPKREPEGGYLGVDLGIKRIATTSDGQTWDGRPLTQARHHYATVRASLQRKKARRNTRSKAKLLKRLSGRERRYQTHVNHVISRRLVDTARDTQRTLRLEDLAGIRERAKVRKTQRRLHHSWAFYQLRTMIAYKAALAGVDVELVNPAYTSKTCSHCHQLGQRQGLVFTCSSCGVLDADHNGARNIAAGGVVNHPEIQPPPRHG
jgi:IS605 OrfB family transposase